MHSKCLASYFAHLGTISKSDNCNDENRLLETTNLKVQ